MFSVNLLIVIIRLDQIPIYSEKVKFPLFLYSPPTLGGVPNGRGGM